MGQTHRLKRSQPVKRLPFKRQIDRLLHGKQPFVDVARTEDDLGIGISLDEVLRDQRPGDVARDVEPREELVVLLAAVDRAGPVVFGLQGFDPQREEFGLLVHHPPVEGRVAQDFEGGAHCWPKSTVR